jgi:hypothetical protein
LSPLGCFGSAAGLTGFVSAVFGMALIICVGNRNPPAFALDNFYISGIYFIGLTSIAKYRP